MRLHIDGQDIRMNAFVGRIVSNVAEGICRSLDDFPEEPQAVAFTVEAGSGVTLIADGSTVRLNAFVQDIVGNILQALAASLEGVPARPARIELEL